MNRIVCVFLLVANMGTARAAEWNWNSAVSPLCSREDSLVDNISIFPIYILPKNSSLFAVLSHYSLSSSSSFPLLSSCKRTSKKSGSKIVNVGDSCTISDEVSEEWQVETDGEISGKYLASGRNEFIEFEDGSQPVFQWVVNGKVSSLGGPVTHLCRRNVGGKLLPDILGEYKRAYDGKLSYFRVRLVK